MQSDLNAEGGTKRKQRCRIFASTECRAAFCLRLSSAFICVHLQLKRNRYDHQTWENRQIAE
jgi:hypothetical protein